MGYYQSEREESIGSEIFIKLNSPFDKIEKLIWNLGDNFQ